LSLTFIAVSSMCLYHSLSKHHTHAVSVRYCILRLNIFDPALTHHRPLPCRVHCRAPARLCRPAAHRP
jgi:hypothetical protein